MLYPSSGAAQVGTVFMIQHTTKPAEGPGIDSDDSQVFHRRQLYI